MPLPKRRHSKARSRTRNSHNAIPKPAKVYCPKCGNFLPGSHVVCGNCGSYQGRPMVDMEGTA